jgi:hypothetical protein
MRTFANKRRRSWSRFRSPPGLHVSHGLLQSSDTQGSRRRGNDGPDGSLFTTQRAVVHKRKRTKKKMRNLPRLWISRSPMTKLQKAATAPPAYPQPVAVPYTSLVPTPELTRKRVNSMVLALGSAARVLISPPSSRTPLPRRRRPRSQHRTSRGALPASCPQLAGGRSL